MEIQQVNIIEKQMLPGNFIQACFDLGIGPTNIRLALLVKTAFPEIEDASIVRLIAEQEDLQRKEPEAIQKHPKPPIKERGKITIHSVIMEDLRNGQDNKTIITHLISAFPGVLVQKLKQRVYEYRNQFNHGKIK
jgi:hypothetical protein